MSVSHGHVVEKLREEHGELREAQRGVAEALERFGMLGPVAGPRLEREVRGFAGHLLRHLAYEELDGYLRVELTSHPEVAPGAERLRAQHDEMRGKVRRMLADLETRIADPEEVLLLATDLKDLFLFLHAHEEAESRFSIDAFWSDEGAGD